MKIRFTVRIAAWFMAAALIAEGVAVPTSVGAQSTGQTAPGTNITNNATATYKDANSNTYNTTSNTVTTIVQNAPVTAEAAAAGSQYSPGQIVTDQFTLTNQGNAAGDFQVSGNGYAVNGSTGVFTTVTDATIGGTDSDSNDYTFGESGTVTAGCGTGSTVEYSVYNPNTSTTTNCDNVTDLNTFLATQSIPAYTDTADDTVTVSVYYAITSSAPTTGSPSITSTLNSNIEYAAVSGAAQEVSSVATATESNTVVSDANVNQYKTSSQCASTPCSPTTDNLGDITYTISATDGGSKAAKDLASVKALLGGAWSNINGGSDSGGVLLTDKIPQFNGTPLTLSNVSGSNYQVTVTPNTTYGFPTGSTDAYVVYSTSSSGSTWAVASGGPATPSAGSATTFTIPTSVGTIYYIGVVIVNGTCSTTGYDLCSYTTNTTTNGNSSVASYPAVQYSYTVAEPTGNGSANAGSVLNVSDAMWGSNSPTEDVYGPGISAGTSDTSCAGSCLNQQTVGINYISSGLAAGSSNQTSNQALASYGALTGPYDSVDTTYDGAAATGSYDGVVTSNDNDDFTALGFGSSSDQIVNTGTTAGTPTTSTTTGAGSTLCVEHSLYNSGNKSDSYDIAIGAQPTGYAIPNTSGGTLSSGWTFGVYSDNACSVALGGSSQGSTTTAANVSVSSGSILTYYVKYAIPSGLKYFTRFDVTITATSTNDSTKTNTTHDELYSSFIALTKTENSAATNCPSGALAALPSSSATQVCPGGTISYTLDYRNLVMGTASTDASFANCYTQAGEFTITDDGTQATTSSATTPNWATFTTGLQTAPTDDDSAGGARSEADASVFTYWNDIPKSGGGSGTLTAGATAFTDEVGGSGFQLVPHGYFTSGISGNPTMVSEPAPKDWQGTISFTLTVK